MSINDKMQQEVLLRAWQDEKFKNALIKDPKKTLKDEFDIIIPDNVQITILEDTDNHLYMVIPKKPPLPGCRKIIWFLPPHKK